jgi:hypothetical protein
MLAVSLCYLHASCNGTLPFTPDVRLCHTFCKKLHVTKGGAVIKNSIIGLLLWSNVSYVYTMDSIFAHVSERRQQVALGCLALVITGFTIKKFRSYYLFNKVVVSQVPQDIQLKYENIKVRLNLLKMDIEYATKPLHEFEKDRFDLLQEIMPDIVLEHKKEYEIHQRLMERLCPKYTSLALAIGDVNQALLNLKKKQEEQQELNVKGYVL